MPVTGGNFDHLEEFDAALARFGAHAERYFLDDANTALIKVRQFAERLAMVVSERSGLDLEPRAAFADVLHALQIDGSAPREILDLLHRLRKTGNTAVHDAAGERREAFDCIKIAHQLGVWLRASLTNQPRLTIAFRPPRLAPDETAELRAMVETLRARLAETETAAETATRLARESEDARLTAEDRARLAEEERAIYAGLAEEAEAKATARPVPEVARRFMAAAVEAARDIDLDEDDTRLLIDEQLRAAGWEVDSRTLRHGKGARPEKGRSRAIAEWPTASGPADYALFVGEALVGVVEAKRRRRDVSAAVHQAERYAEGIDLAQGGSVVGGPWGKFIAPFAFATNGRAFYPQFRLQSGIWRRDLRRASNPAEPLEGWPTPDGLMERLALDRDAAEAALKERPFDFGFELRPYQIAAIRAVEGALAADRREMLVAMATGTGKTKLSIALIYRLLEAKRFNRVCFVVDRSALGEQAEGAFRTTRVLDARTFADVFGLKGLGDRDIDRDAKVHVCTVQSLVQRVLGRAPEDRPPVDQYDLILIDECHRGYLLDREMSEAEMAFRDQDDYISKYRRVIEYFDAVKVGLTATPALHTAQIFGDPRPRRQPRYRLVARRRGRSREGPDRPRRHRRRHPRPPARGHAGDRGPDCRAGRRRARGGAGRGGGGVKDGADVETVERLPKGWASATMAEIGTVDLGRQRSPENHQGPHMRPYLRAANVTWSGVDLSDVLSMNFDEADFERYALASGDVLINEGSGSAAEVGKPAIWRGEIEGCCFQNTLLRVRPTACTSEYVHRYLLHAAKSRRFVPSTQGVNIFHIGKAGLARFPIPVPPLPEQRRIVAKLDRLSARTSAARRHLARVAALAARAKQAILAAAFNGDLTADWREESAGDDREAHPAIGLLPPGWRIRRLDEIADIQTGLALGKKRRDGEQLTEQPYLRVANVQRGWLKLKEIKLVGATRAEIEKLTLRDGDILMNEGGDRDKLGRGWVWEGQIDGCIHQNHVFRVRLRDPAFPPRLVSYFANEFGQQFFIDEGQQTTNLASISKGRLSGLPVPMPSASEAQEIVRRIEAAFARIDRLADESARAARLLDRLDERLLAKAFRGDLVPQDPADEPAAALLARLRESSAAARRRGRGRKGAA